ncbi:hypothetical protein CAURIM_07830 [Corynebacterium aurimucosum]|nr:hypothetical protein CAURIM_07830 [Corynebacterium aurimucosum]
MWDCLRELVLIVQACHIVITSSRLAFAKVWITQWISMD